MVLALLLFDRANEHGRVDSPRALLSTALRRPVGAPGDEARHPARRERTRPLAEERQHVLGMAHKALDTAQQEGLQGFLTASLFGLSIGAEHHAN